jgi:hypothetical protein
MTELRKAAEMALAYIEQALAQHDQQYQRHPSTERDRQVIVNDLEALRQALAQPVDAVNISQERVDETAKGEQEPVAWIGKGRCQQLQEGESVTTTLTNHRAFLDDVPLYTSPKKREWVGLTADEIWKCNKAKTGSAVEFHICVCTSERAGFCGSLRSQTQREEL